MTLCLRYWMSKPHPTTIKKKKKKNVCGGGGGGGSLLPKERVCSLEQIISFKGSSQLKRNAKIKNGRVASSESVCKRLLKRGEAHALEERLVV